MNLKATKTPLLIAAMATAVMLTTLVPANAKGYWVSGSSENAQLITADYVLSDGDAQIIDAKFKKHRSHRSHKSHRSHRSFKHHRSFKRHKGVRGTAFHRGHGFKKRLHADHHHGTKKKVYIKKYR